MCSFSKNVFSLVAFAIVFLGFVNSQELAEIPSDLTFSCEGKAYGYYADIETNCQVFHICLGDGDVKWSFLCPNQTIFNQQYFVCDYALNVDCNQAPSYFNLNDNFGQVISKEDNQRPRQERLAATAPQTNVEIPNNQRSTDQSGDDEIELSDVISSHLNSENLSAANAVQAADEQSPDDITNIGF